MFFSWRRHLSAASSSSGLLSAASRMRTSIIASTRRVPVLILWTVSTPESSRHFSNSVFHIWVILPRCAMRGSGARRDRVRGAVEARVLLTFFAGVRFKDALPEWFTGLLSMTAILLLAR